MASAYPLLLAVMLLALPARLAAEEPGLLIGEVLASVKDGLAAARSQLTADDNLPDLQSVELVLETSLTKKTGGGFNLWVLAIGAKYQREAASKLALRLEPPAAVAPVSSNQIRDSLANMIVAAAEGTHRLHGGPTPLKLQQVVAELKFVVEKSAEGGAKFTISPVTVDVLAGLGNKSVQTIKVTFARRP